MTVRVETITPPAKTGATRALAWVRIEDGGLAVTCGPWRVVVRDGRTPRIYPPSVLVPDGWTPCIRLDHGTHAAVVRAVEAAYAQMDDGAAAGTGA